MSSASNVDEKSEDLARRRTHVFAALLLLIGAAAGLLVFSMLGPSAAEWNAQVTQDALPLTQLLRYDLRIDDAAAVEGAWAKRRVLYDDDHLADLRERLNAFVDLQVREYAAAKQVYLSGDDPARRSADESVLNERLRRAYGNSVADEMLRQFGERVRESAYRASPKVAGGADPEAPRFDEMYDDLVADWLPQARATVERLTAPTR